MPRIIGLSPDIARDSSCDARTTLEGDCDVRGKSSIVNSALENTKTYATELDDCATGNSTLINVSATHSSLRDSFISDAIIQRSHLRDCEIRGLNILNRVKLSHVIVDGACQLIGPWEMRGPYYIYEGIWHRAPRAIIVEGHGVRLGVTESIEGRIAIGCRLHSMTRVLRSGPRWGRMIGWTEGQVEQVRLFIEELQDVRLVA